MLSNVYKAFSFGTAWHGIPAIRTEKTAKIINGYIIWWCHRKCQTLSFVTKARNFHPFSDSMAHQANLSGLERGAQPLPLWLRNNLTIWHKVWGVRNSVSSLKMFNVQSVTSLKYEDLCKLEVDTLIGLLIKQDPKLRHKWHMPSWIKTNLVQFQSSSS